MKGDEKAPHYESFYNPQAIAIMKWINAENNTIKRAKLYRTACRLEYRYRNSHKSLYGVGFDKV